ncbi:MAG: EamA family transporter, partial [Candidatus Planktophila sp.]
KMPVIGIVSVFIALAGSTIATLLQKKFGAGIPLLAGTAYQYLASGLVLAALAGVTGGVHIQWTSHFIAVFLWLLFGLSFGAILLLLWLLNTGTAASVSSLMYLVPPVTAVEAYILFGEKVNTQGFLGIGICALGVWLVMRSSN